MTIAVSDTDAFVSRMTERVIRTLGGLGVLYDPDRENETFHCSHCGAVIHPTVCGRATYGYTCPSCNGWNQLLSVRQEEMIREAVSQTLSTGVSLEPQISRTETVAAMRQYFGDNLTPDLDNQPGEDWIMSDDASVWLSVRNLSVYVHQNRHGLSVEILPRSLGDDAFQPALDIALARWPEQDA